MTISLNEKTFYKILHKLGIKAKDKILVTSNILRIIQNKKNELKPNEIIQILKNIVSDKGNLFFPTYNWQFCKSKEFDYNKTRSLTGALSNLTLEKDEFVRSSNPIYSFSIFGKDKKKISLLKHKSCFGLDSPFGYLINNKGKQLFIDLDYKEAFTFAHVAEETAQVNYRYQKNFSGIYINAKKQKIKKVFTMYCRKINEVKSTIITNKFDNILKKNKAIKTIKFKSLVFSIVDIPKAYDLMVKDLKNNEGGIIPEKV